MDQRTINIALAGNPNSGKSTLFNSLTGSNQYVGNWPGVTVEKKTGKYIKNKNINITDLPGTYSLSPYTLEEVVARDYLINDSVDLIIDVIDASNIERSLYLASQLSELGIPLILALNMMDVVEKKGDKINIELLEDKLNCKVVEITASQDLGVDKLMETALKQVAKGQNIFHQFSSDIEYGLSEIQSKVNSLEGQDHKRFLAVKLFEKDKDVFKKLGIREDEETFIHTIVSDLEEKYDDDSESILTDQRYTYITKLVSQTVDRSRRRETTTEKIDKIVTNKILSLPIFILVMAGVYFLAMEVVGGPITDWVNEVLISDWISGGVEAFLLNHGIAGWLVSLIVDGIIGGVGAVLGFLPVIAALFLFIAILEDCGYMSRVAFILDRLLRKFGLSGRSFVPILMGIGCSVPAIMGTRTIENEKDRRMTIMVTSFMPCGAKSNIIAAFAAVATGKWWFGPLWYFAGILAVIFSGIILKKTQAFYGDPSPFVMELPDYHLPRPKNVLRTTGDRAWSFIKNAGTVVLVASIIIWLLQNISIDLNYIESSPNQDSILQWAGKKTSFIFEPLGFGNWIATVSTFAGLVAKELVVGTMGVIAGLGEVEAGDPSLTGLLAQNFTLLSTISFVLYNQLTVPCFAAIGAIKSEIGGKKWTAFAIAYQLIFSWTICLMVYQFGLLFLGNPFTFWSGLAILVALTYAYLIFRPNKYEKLQKQEVY